MSRLERFGAFDDYEFSESRPAGIFLTWDETSHDSTPFTPPITSPEDKTPTELLDEADGWYADEIGAGRGIDRTYAQHENGTHLLTARDNNQLYIVAWHPFDHDKLAAAMADAIEEANDPDDRVRFGVHERNVIGEWREIFFVWGEGVTATAKQARAMAKKSRAGNGR